MNGFALLPWWGYLLAAVLGLGFGCLQIGLLHRATREEGMQKWLIAVKFLLWAGAMFVVAWIAIPLLIVFVGCATAALLLGLRGMYRKAQGEANDDA